jgi:hypothetical protein
VTRKITGTAWFINSRHYKISQFYRRKNSVGLWLEVRQWFFYRRHHRQNTSAGFTFVGDSPFRRYFSRKNKKTFTDGFTDGTCAPKKKDSRLKYTDGFSFRQWSYNYRRKIAVVKSVGECMKYRWNISVGNFVGASLKYRPNSSVGEILGNSFFLNLFLKNYLGYII